VIAGLTLWLSSRPSKLEQRGTQPGADAPSPTKSTTIPKADVRVDPPPITTPEWTKPRPVPSGAKPTSLSTASITEQQELIERELRSLETGQILYNPPTRVRLGVPERVHVRIGGPAVPESKLRAGFARSEAARQDSLRISPLMTVTLTGVGFEIVPATPAEQFLLPDEPTEWSWTVKGTEPGRNILNLSARVKLLGQERQFKSFDTDIEVWVTRMDRLSMFIAQYWQWLIATVISSGLLGGLYRRFHRKNEPKPWESV
jgi:hypothetical protein